MSRVLFALTSWVVFVAIQLSPALALDETRRQLGSELINQVFGWDGTGVNVGQIELSEPLNHPNVAATGRGGAGVTLGLHALEVASVMVSDHATYTGMAPGATLRSDDKTNNGLANSEFVGDNDYLDSVRWLTTGNPSAKVINNSFGFKLPSTGVRKVTLGTDWLITNYDFLFVAGAGNDGDEFDEDVLPPSVAYNGIAVGATASTDYINGTDSDLGPTRHRFDRLANYSSYGTDVAAPGLPKPDLVIPSSLEIT